MSVVADDVTEYHSRVSGYYDLLGYGIAGWGDDVPFCDYILPALGSLISSDVCAVSPDHLHHGVAQRLSEPRGSGDTFMAYVWCVCDYCETTFTIPLTAAELAAAEAEFIDTLDTPTVSKPIVIPAGYASYNGVILPNIDSVWTDKVTYPYAVIYYDSKSGNVFLCLTTKVVNIFNTSSNYLQTSDYTAFTRVRYQLGSSAWTSYRLSQNHYQIGDVGDICWASTYIFDEFGAIYLDSSNPIVPGDGFSDSDLDSSTRTGALFQTINQYNTTNNYEDDASAVNFYLGVQDDTGAVIDLYAPVLYDEETMIFTEPTTSTEYQTTAWTYDYTTRSYDITLDSGTMTMSGSDVTRIVLTYGDDAVSVAYYNGSTLIQTDVFAYVMVSQSMCNIDGHSYTYETVKESTCTAMGERKYTCSVCGDEYAEDIPMGNHAYEYSVLKEATCISGGTNVSTCSICGDQTVEQVPELGHDWQQTASTSTSYALPAGTSCPDCAGADFAAELDEQAGTYSCTCNGCGTVWTVSAVITQGTTTYTCSRCGTTKTESDDAESGLFHSIGNLIADGITWAVDKLKELIENLSGITDIFNDYVDSVKENTGQYPALLGAIIALMPEDFMTVIWFGVVALIVLAVWKKWFS